jgi:hypothetical protein
MIRFVFYRNSGSAYPGADCAVAAASRALMLKSVLPNMLFYSVKCLEMIYVTMQALP